MTDKDKPEPNPLPKCDTCGKILLHCTCSKKELKK